MIPPHLSLLPFQPAGIQSLVAKTRWLLADDPGAGKTIQLIAAVNVLQQHSDVPLEVLVIAPKGVVISWERHVAEWSVGPANYTIINHDKLITKDGKKYLKAWDVVIADESHQYLKNGNCQRARSFAVINDLSDVVWLSTATPASKSAEDYYHTLKILLPDLFKNISKSRFIGTFCNRVKDKWCYSGYKFEGFKNQDELNKIFSKCSLKRKQEEIAQYLPELTMTDYFCDVKGVAQVDDDLLEYIRAGKEVPSEYHAALKHNALLKLPSVIELLESYPPEVKVVIFAWHRDVVAEYVKAIKEIRTCDYITGEINDPVERQDKIDAFQEGDLNTLVLNMQSGGVGITLTAATKGIYVQFPYSAIHWKQSQKRVHRIGSKLPVQIVKVMIAGSIDEEVFSVLEDRVTNIERVGV